jgi:hypothetical protein
MAAALAAALACGAVVAVLMDPNAEAGFVVILFLLSFLGALVIAAAIVAPLAIVRRRRPGGAALAVALTAGGLVTFPVHNHFYDDASFAAEGGGVGACHGILPLAQAVRDDFAHEPYGRLYYFASCNE